MTNHALIPNYVCDYETTRKKIEDKKRLDKQYYDKTAREREEFKEGENITLRKGKEWVPAKILSKEAAPRSYTVKDEQNHIYRRNSSFLRKSLNEPNFIGEGLDEEEPSQTTVKENLVSPKQEQCSTRSNRIRNPPIRLEDYVMY